MASTAFLIPFRPSQSFGSSRRPPDAHSEQPRGPSRSARMCVSLVCPPKCLSSPRTPMLVSSSCHRQGMFPILFPNQTCGSGFRSHPRINTCRIKIKNIVGEIPECTGRLYCSVRSCEKQGAPVETVSLENGFAVIQTATTMFAPSSGQTAVIYKDIGDGNLIIVLCGSIF